MRTALIRQVSAFYRDLGYQFGAAIHPSTLKQRGGIDFVYVFDPSEESLKLI
jgi:hypothetical protein